MMRKAAHEAAARGVAQGKSSTNTSRPDAHND